MLARQTTRPSCQLSGKQDLADRGEEGLQIRDAVSDPVLVVDLDRALVRSENVRETLLAVVAATPLAQLGESFSLLLGSRSNSKETEPPALAPNELLCDEAVLDVIRAARAEGRRTALISTASHEKVAAVAEHLGLFDDAIGSTDGTRDEQAPTATPRVDALEVRYGAGGYDYIGNQMDDLAVWARARHAFAARPSRQVKTAAEKRGIRLASVSENAKWSIWPLIKAIRPHQWSKNVLILLPIIASHTFGALGMALLAMVAFSLMASSVYILNDIADLPSDRAHPRKRRRPFASGEAQISHGLVLAVLLVASAMALSLAFLPSKFLAVLLLYLLGTVAYTFWLKRKLLIDIIALAGLYTARILAGGAATGIALSPWLLAFSMFLFFSLAAIKRQAELLDQERTGRSVALGRAYFTDDLPIVRVMAVSSGQAAVLILALYLNNPATVGLYAQPYIMWLLCPILFYWLGRMELMTHRGFMDDDPIVFACRDGISLLCLLASAVVVMAAVIGY